MLNGGIKKWASTLLFAMLAIFLIYYMYSSADKESVAQSFKRANYFWAIIAAIIALLSHISRAIRWRLIIQSLGYQVSTINAIWAVLLGFLSNAVIPRSGELLKCGALGRKENVPVEKLIGTVIAERFVDLLMLIALVLGTLYFQRDFIGGLIEQTVMPGLLDKMNLFANWQTWVGLIGFLLVFVLVILIFRRIFGKKVIAKINILKSGLLDGVRALFKIKKPFTFIGQTLLIWMAYFFSGFVVFKAFDETSNLGIDAGFTALTMGSLGMLVPAPNGLGSYHFLVEEALKLYNITGGAAVAYPWITWTANTVVIIVGGLLALRVLLKSN